MIKTTKWFVNKSNQIHNCKYNYSSSIYKGSKDQIDIICLKHGAFSQEAGSHMRGSGCPSCSRNKKLTTKIFIERANCAHNKTYDYSKVKYKSLKHKVIIICRKHGEFSQNAFNHLNGNPCPHCSGRIIVLKELLERFNKKHKDTFEYSNVVYKDMFSKVKITCTKHGNFMQTPSNHLKGQGCNRCTSNISKMENEWLDYLKIPSNCRQQYLPINNKRFYVDGLDVDNKIVYEFYGDFWHGNPKVYNENNKNRVTGKTFGYLYNKTLEKERVLKNAGYSINSIWELDWKALKKNGFKYDR